MIEQVTDALDASDIDLGITRDDLINGVRQALETLGDGIDVQFDVMTSMQDSEDEGPMDVSVVEGGRSDSDPPTPGDKPHLRVAEPENEGSELEPDVDMVAPPPKVVTKVKVLRTPPRVVSQRNDRESIPGLKEAGWISVVSGGGVESSWQTLYQGQRVRIYRVACTHGTLDITVDGLQVERLRPGQSIDVEGSLVRVTTPDGAEAKGGYAQVRPVSVGEE